MYCVIGSEFTQICVIHCSITRICQNVLFNCNITYAFTLANCGKSHSLIFKYRYLGDKNIQTLQIKNIWHLCIANF